ncbi:hypothetical protein T4C_3845 [Trichinella pseudospiralis]|uniref:Uncharacterized protein n=1 Tax=Trichinella pseudospiralis TaxID=6337 RepID=A0A0V1K3M9_TRIPS|nr:hypothetical protein T4C_3845 [Trichinella pseudospiralis]
MTDLHNFGSFLLSKADEKEHIQILLRAYWSNYYWCKAVGKGDVYFDIAFSKQLLLCPSDLPPKFRYNAVRARLVVGKGVQSLMQNIATKWAVYDLQTVIAAGELWLYKRGREGAGAEAGAGQGQGRGGWLGNIDENCADSAVLGEKKKLMTQFELQLTGSLLMIACTEEEEEEDDDAISSFLECASQIAADYLITTKKPNLVKLQLFVFCSSRFLFRKLPKLYIYKYIATFQFIQSKRMKCGSLLCSDNCIKRADGFNVLETNNDAYSLN